MEDNQILKSFHLQYVINSLNFGRFTVVIIMKLKLKYIISIFILCSLLTVSCSNKYLKLDNDLDDKVPNWFIESSDEDENNLYAVATAISPDMQLSLEKSKMLAINNLAQKLEGLLNSNFIVSSINDRVISEGDINIIVENFSTRGFKEEKKEIFKTKQNRYRTYIKISLNKALIKSFDDYIIESR